MVYAMAPFKAAVLCAALLMTDAAAKLGPAEEILQHDHAARSNNQIVGTPQRHAGLSLWPWNHHDSNKSDDNSCHALTTCLQCTDTTLCHWCDHDQACHARGSVYGCAWGSSCNHAPPKPPNNDTCAAHVNCNDCAQYTACHWCAHDNACHTMGSPYGCLSGVDCYSNEHCQRTTSEPLQHDTFAQIGSLPLAVILVVALVSCCCVSLCYGVASGLKGAYDDLTDLAQRDDDAPSYVAPGSFQAMVEAAQSNGHHHDAPAEEEDDEEAAAADDGVQAEGNGDNATLAATPAENSWTVDTTEAQQQELATPLLSTPAVARARRPKHMQRLYNMCTACYGLALLSIVTFVGVSVCLFPKRPIYNVCNDQVAWSSIITQLENLKPGTDFQILISIANPNHFAVAVDLASGSFTHDSTFVGTFEIPPFTAPAMSITDALLIAHLTPEKLEIGRLVLEFALGHLVLDVTAQAGIRVPVLLNYSFETHLQDLRINVNEQSDRHLCHCSSWNNSVASAMIVPPPPPQLDGR